MKSSKIKTINWRQDRGVNCIPKTVSPPDRSPFTAHCSLLMGMTLIELLLVIMIMAIIMAFAVPAFVGLGRGAGLRSAVNGVRSTLALSRQWAITHREDVYFVYGNTSENHSAWYAVSNLSGFIMGIVSNNDVVFVKPDGITIWPDDEPLNVVFRSDGSLGVVGSATEYVVLGNRIGPRQPVHLQISPLTGGIQVQ